MERHFFCFLLAVVLFASVTTAVQNNCITGCKCDEILSTRLLKIKECDSPLILNPSSLKDISKKITVIVFRNVAINRISNDAFSQFEHLEKVLFEDAQINSIDSQAFQLQALQTLAFNNTTFREVPNLRADSLEELIFKDCKLTQVPKLDLPGLTFLSLENNFIKEVDQTLFQLLDNLEEVNFSNNSISTLPPNLFIDSEDFTVLTIDNNPLTTLEFNYPTQIEKISAKNCKLTKIDRNTMKNLTLVSDLYLGGNEISVLPIDVFEQVTDLHVLDLSNNKLTEIDNDIFAENSNLDKVIFDNNNFGELPHFNSKEKTLQITYFSCQNCGLNTVKDVFKNMKHLTTLILSDNNLESIDGVFLDLPKLTKLSLSNNKITNVGIDAFGKSNSLKTLDLSYNLLAPLDSVVFGSLSVLELLNVSNCQMTKLWANLNAELPKLETLLINGNKLQHLNEDDVSILPRLKLLDIRNNAFVCDDDLRDMVDHLLEKKVNPVEVATTHEDLVSDTLPAQYTAERSWQSVLPDGCTIYNNYDDDDDDQYDDESQDDTDDEDDQINIEDKVNVIEDKEDGEVEASVLSTGGFNLAKASYVLSITSVFILTALLVLFVAVAVILLIMKRNNSFNMHNGNLPRLKIPLWHTQPGHKKHSGSVYKPLSEELSLPRTPMVNRYEFKTPQVHNSLP